MRSRVGPRPGSARQPKLQRRRTKRKPANKPIFLYRHIEGAACNPEAAVIIDISIAGIGLILASPMEKETEFAINLAPFDSSLVYRAVQCRRCGAESYRVGAEFLHRIAGATVGSLEQDIERIRRAILA
ncbi:MAG TPA: PilZ domain-containing protein [Tepidisphaeraceae bacterium]|nr:PilZ domain-containing protein [Tepidisphaeraceae bacterium]